MHAVYLMPVCLDKVHSMLELFQLKQGLLVLFVLDQFNCGFLNTFSSVDAFTVCFEN